MNPANAKFVCGAECGVTTGTASGGTEHWSGISPTVAVVTSGPSPMRSTRCFKFTEAGPYLTHTFATAIASPATMVARFYVYFATLPVNTSLLVPGVGSSIGAYFQASDSKIYARNGAGTLGATGVSVTTNAWYCIDVKIVRGTTETVDVSVDGTACGQASRSTTAASITSIALGPLNDNVGETYIDDLVISATGGDWPIGEGTTVGLYPNGDRTNTEANPNDGNGGHVYSGISDFVKDGSTKTDLGAQNVESTSWQSLTNPLSTTIDTANYVADQTGGNAEHLVWTLDDLPAEASAINGVMAVATTHSASATGNNQSLAYLSTTTYAHRITLWGALDLSEATITVPCAIAPTAATQFVAAWTPTLVNATVIAWGDSSDVNPDPYLDGVVLEVDYVSAAAPGFALPKRGHTQRTQALAVRGGF